MHKWTLESRLAPTCQRRKIIRNSSLSKDNFRASNTSKLITQKAHSKNSSYELKPIVSHVSLSSTAKKLATATNNPNLRKKLSEYMASPSKTSVKNLISPNKPKKVEFPLKPKDAVLVFSQDLTSYEQAEILDYTDVYFLGNKTSKITPKLELSNFGFDDKRGDLKVVKGDHIAYRYEILGILGKGSFGQVCECYDYKRNEKAAVKIIRNKKRFHHQAGIEVSILSTIRERDAADQKPVIKMKNYFLFRKHVCISFDLWGINLYELLKNNKFQGLSIALVRRFAVQVLNGLNFMSNLEIIHCDLKPENILLKFPQKSEIVIIDFGSATFYKERQHTYIQSRFYRAPEIILGIPYTIAIDMWSLGCILAELYTGRPLLPGESEHDQLVLIMEMFGTPSSNVLAKSTKKDLFFDGKVLKDPTIKNGVLKIPGSKKLYESVCSTDEDFLDFISKCLEIDPCERMTPQAALQHPWMQSKNRSHKLGNSLNYLVKKPSKVKLFLL